MNNLLVLPKGYHVKCPNGHLVAITNRDINIGDTGYDSAFDYEPNQPIPVIGQTTDPVCYCGTPWFSLATIDLIVK